MRLLNRVVTNFYDDALRPLGLKISQVNILIATAKLGEARPAQVCEILQLDTSTLSRNVDRMARRAGSKCARSRRRPPAAVPADCAGEAIDPNAVPAWEAAQRQAAELLGEGGIALLEKAAKKLRGSKTQR